MLAGIGPPPRQPESSTETLMDPAVAVPDPYGWLRDEAREKQEVLDHLKAENAYTEALTAPLQGLRQELYDEFLASIQETDHSVPRARGDWWYYTRTLEGKSYTVHCRAPKTTSSVVVDWDGTPESPILPNEEVVLNVNQLAEGKSYCATGSVTTSPSHKLLAYSVDFKGDETCGLYVKDLATDETVHHDESLEIYGSLKWGADDSTLFYLKMDETQRPFQVYRKTLGSDDQHDELLFQDSDELYWVHMYKSLDNKYLFIDSSSKETSEVHYLNLTDPNATLQCIAKRRTKVLYEVEHRNGKWWISTNVGGTPNMRLMMANAEPNCESKWKDIVDKDDDKPLFDGGYDRALSDVSTYKTHVVAQGREGGIPRVWIISLDDSDVVESFEQLTFEETAHDVGISSGYEFDVDSIVIHYDSLVTPLQHIEMELADTSNRTVIKTKNVPGYNKAEYDCDRITVPARDGTEIPVSLVYRKDVMNKFENGERVHVHLYGYGSYGSCIEADFRATRLPLLDRGIVYAIAHVRGGSEMGRQWYEEPNGAKFLCKKNTFNDFVDVGRWLVDTKKLTSPELLSCEGRSAGGLLIGASINQDPTLFKAAILGVPFVDVVPTMIDSTIPLTTAEWLEWGCPNEEKVSRLSMHCVSFIVVICHPFVLETHDWSRFSVLSIHDGI